MISCKNNKMTPRLNSLANSNVNDINIIFGLISSKIDIRWDTKSI